MADAARIVGRLRANGAKVSLDGDGIRIANSHVLPSGSMEFVERHKAEIVAFLRDESTQRDRAPIFCLSRGMADAIARLLIANAPDDPDWTWFCTQATNIMDGVVTDEAAA